MTRFNAHLGLAALVLGGALAAASAADAQGIGEDTLERMLVPTDRKIDRGEQIYQNQCAGCHGPDGRGEVDYPNPDKYANDSPNFRDGEFRYGGGPIQIYNTITYGLPGEDSFHPVYPDNQLRYQQRWAVTHYVRSLVPPDTRSNLTDPPEIRKQAQRRAREGVCRDDVRQELDQTIGKFLEPKGEEQMNTAETLYQNNCQSCHGDTGKGDGPAGQALNPKPRNFHDENAEWTKSTSPLAIYNVLLNGIEGTSMAAYPDMSAEERWALVHYVRQWIPESKRQETTEDDILNLCRSRSAPPAPEPISRETARQALLEDTSDQRAVRLKLYGDPDISPGADPDKGRNLYKQQCASCHGGGLKGANRGPYGSQPPFFRVRIRPLTWRHAGGDYRTFAQRSLAGAHASLIDAPNTAMLTDEEWKDLHAFIATHNAPERISVPTEQTDAESENTQTDIEDNQSDDQPESTSNAQPDTTDQ